MKHLSLSAKNMMLMLLASSMIFDARFAHAGSWSYQPVAPAPTLDANGAVVKAPEVLYGNNQPGVNQYHPTIYTPPPTATVAPSPTPANNNNMMMMMGLAAAALPALLGGKGGNTSNRTTTAPTNTNASAGAPVSSPTSTAPSSGTSTPATSSDRPATAFRGTQDEERDPGRPEQAGTTQESNGSGMLALANAAATGMGAGAGAGKCYVSVKAIIAKAVGKNEACVRGIISGGSAIDAHRNGVLKKAGFKNDMTQCKTKGVIRVYSGHGGGRNAIHGHIEVLGSDSKYWSFFSDYRPLDEYMRPPGSRRLVGCYVPDGNKVAEGPLSRCGPWNGSPTTGYRGGSTSSPGSRTRQLR